MPKEMARGIWRLIDGRVFCYLVVGAEKALMIDSGPGEEDVLALAKSITDLPILLVNTHSHWDHTGANQEFDAVYAHPAEFEALREKNETLIAVTEGYRFDLGGRILTVMECPGHTLGSICIFDEETRTLFPGDTVSDSTVFMNFPGCALAAYAKSLKRLSGLQDGFSMLLGGHGSSPTPKDYIDKLLRLAQGILEGKALENTVMASPDPYSEERIREVALDGATMYRPL